MFKKLLCKKNIKQQCLAIDLGVTQQNISSWCVGRSAPPYKLIPKMANLLNCSIEDIVLCFCDEGEGR